YYNAIEEGLNIKEKALLQVEEYQQKQQELKDKISLSQQISKELEKLQNEIVQLDIIKNNYKTYVKIKELESWLQNNEDKSWEGAPSEYDLRRTESLREEYSQLRKDLQQKENELGIAPEKR